MEILSNKFAYPSSQTFYHEVTKLEEVDDKSLSTALILGSLLYGGPSAKQFSGSVATFDLAEVWFSEQPKLVEGQYYKNYVYYSGGKQYVQTTVWQTKTTYLNNETPIYSGTVSRYLPSFQIIKQVINYEKKATTNTFDIINCNYDKPIFIISF